MFVYVCTIPGALQSYTWSLTYTVTTSGGNPPDGGSQLSCMRSSAPVHPTSSAHRMQVYPYRDEHGWAHHKRYRWMVPIILILLGLLCYVLFCFFFHALSPSYTGSYNYSSYTNQHHHAIQSQYPSLPHDAGLPTPLHYSSYHRSSAQVSCPPELTPLLWICQQCETSH